MTNRRERMDEADEDAAARILQLESENASLNKELQRLRRRGSDQQGSFMASTKQRRRASIVNRQRRHALRDSSLHTVDETGNIRTDKLSRTASIQTADVLRSLPRRASSLMPDGRPGQTKKHEAQTVARRICSVFEDPTREHHVSYLQSSTFAADLVELSDFTANRFGREPRVLRLESPAYVFGDLHGNFEDLHFFADHVWKLGVSLVAGNLVFLGDYVDRGLSSLEVVAYLFALKTLEPMKVWMLRGNHETRDVNGWKDHYHERSFLWQCESRFGPQLGLRVWDAVNTCFDRLPLAAVIDEDIFCVHGGIPRRPDPAALDRLAAEFQQRDNHRFEHTSQQQQQRSPSRGLGASDGVPMYPKDADSPGGGGGTRTNLTLHGHTQPSAEASRSDRMLRHSWSRNSSMKIRSRGGGLGNFDRLDLLNLIPPAITINPPDPDCDPALHQMASECVWSDPALEDQEHRHGSLDDEGFGDSLRGGGTVCFGQRAIDGFLRETGCSFIMRAHEAHAYGVSLSKMATVFTIFSTSKDHHQGKMAQCGCVLVDLNKLQVINRSPHYKNRYVHRRNSSALLGLDPDQVNQRNTIGLIIPDDRDNDHRHNFDDDDNFDDDEDIDDLDQDLLPDLDEEDDDDDLSPPLLAMEDDDEVDALARQVPEVSMGFDETPKPAARLVGSRYFH